MSSRRSGEAAAAIMDDFARSTGVLSGAEPDRYLWTDAFAVCNLAGLHRATGEARWLQTARALVDQVHHVLGRHRPDDSRTGWLSGLEGKDAEDHPTRGGLRIGKTRPERGMGEPADPSREWDRDGQYFHYLTRWMHALDVMGGETGEAHFVRWAAELAEVAERAFVFRDATGRTAMYWKMSIDLTRPLVPSMGQHDPLDGYVRCLQLLGGLERAEGLATSVRRGLGSRMREGSATYLEMVRRGSLLTQDPLGLGGLLVAAVHLQQLQQREIRGDSGLVRSLLGAAAAGIVHWRRSAPLDRPPGTRLPFRELGLAIGLRGAAALAEGDLDGGGTLPAAEPLDDVVEACTGDGDLAWRIIDFWKDGGNRERNWEEHRAINSVMLATALDPRGYLTLPGPGEEAAADDR